MSVRIDDETRGVLASAVTDGTALRIPGQLDPKQYRKVSKVLEAAGGKWNRKAAAHLFPGDAAPVVARLLADGEVTPERAVQQYFPTPPDVADHLIGLADLDPSHVVLEPSAGRGAIAERVAPLVTAIDCVELHEQHAAVIRAKGYARTVTVADFLTVAPDPVFDRAAMNPPFTRNADIAHVRHALGFLKPGGLLVAVMSGGVTWHSDKTAARFRDLVTESGGEFEELPDGSFAASGTGVSAVTVTIPA